jgi:L-ascorbate 6-phosphate lactonase
MESRQYMQPIREYEVAADAVAIWFLGQNGFLIKDAAGSVIGIDLYLTSSCAEAFAHLPYRVDRQLPVFIEPEDLDIDAFVTTHSHQDHADPETIRRLKKAGGTIFLGPPDSISVYRQCGVTDSCCRLLHPRETVRLSSSTTVQATSALQTDATDVDICAICINGGFHNLSPCKLQPLLRQIGRG